MFDYSKLLGRIKEKDYTQDSLSAATGINRSSLSMKLRPNNTTRRQYFKQTEISKISELLDIPPDKIGEYFFTPVFVNYKQK